MCRFWAFHSQRSNVCRWQHRNALYKYKTLSAPELPIVYLVTGSINSFFVDALLQNQIIKRLVDSFVNKLQVDGDQVDRILGFVQTKRKPTKGIGLLYFWLMDLYLEHLDYFIYETINKSGLNCFWSRCLNTAILGFTDKKTVFKLNDILQLHIVLPAWGLTAKVRSGTRGGRVLRPWQGKLYINTEGHLQWERPESIIEM